MKEIAIITFFPYIYNFLIIFSVRKYPYLPNNSSSLMSVLLLVIITSEKQFMYLLGKIATLIITHTYTPFRAFWSNLDLTE